MSKHKSTIKKTITNIYPVTFLIFVWKIFSMLSIHLWRSSFLVSIHIFLNVFRRMRASMRTVYREVSYLRLSNKHWDICIKLQKPCCKHFDDRKSQVTSQMKAASPIFIIEKKEQCFQLSLSRVRTLFCTLFSRARSGAEWKLSPPKIVVLFVFLFNTLIRYLQSIKRIVRRLTHID